jgi:ubiquinone/menaquinone biosynthesis C-methylase UbiE
MNNLSAGECDVVSADLDPGVINILGEVLWHTVTLDPSIVNHSYEHLREVEKHVHEFLPSLLNRQSVRFLEVASYAHITGYLLAQKYDWNVTLSDISVQTLNLGARQAQQNQLDPSRVRRVAIDFHDLPFSDGSFDVVYIASALHHTLRWQTVLKELQRVTVPGGLLILQNEPCRREFCFYKFSTNRPDSFRPIEIELQQSGILNTIAEPYLGSRPEMLFGMVENQKMPLPEILEILNSEGIVESLSINSSICMSNLDNAILAAPRNAECTSSMIKNELWTRLDKAYSLLTPTDSALGYCLPTLLEVTEMARGMSHSLDVLPKQDSQNYDVAVANLFGGSITAVMRKLSGSPAMQPDQLLYFNGNRNGVDIGYPPALTKILDLSHDLAPDIQTAELDDISRCFNSSEWLLDGNGDLRYLVLTSQTGSIRLQNTPNDHCRLIVLLRIYGAPVNTPFRIQLFVDQVEIAGVDVYQADSFLLRGEMLSSKDMQVSIHVCSLNNETLLAVPPVSVAALRVVWIADVTGDIK